MAAMLAVMTRSRFRLTLSLLLTLALVLVSVAANVGALAAASAEPCHMAASGKCMDGMGKMTAAGKSACGALCAPLLAAVPTLPVQHIAKRSAVFDRISLSVPVENTAPDPSPPRRDS